MNVNRLATSAVALSLATVVAASVTAQAAVHPLNRGEHGCTNTNPEYTVSDANAHVYYRQGSTEFTAVHNGTANWDDAYLVTGYNRGSSAQVLCGHYGYDYAYQLPFAASAPVSIRGTMTYGTTGNFSGRFGWDLWLVRNGEQFRETTSTAMEHDHRTLEVMVSLGRYGRVYSVTRHGRWNRVYIGGGSLRGVDLAYLTRIAMRAASIRQSDYQWEAIDGGVEFTHGTFNMNGYALNISTSVSKKRYASATASYTASSRGYSITAVRHVKVFAVKTVTLPVKGNPLSVQRGTAAYQAVIRADAAAKQKAYATAHGKAHDDATSAMFTKLHPYRKLPNVRHKRLGTAISTLRRNGFRNLRWTRHLRPSAVVIWEAGHPGKVTRVTARIILRAKRA